MNSSVKKQRFGFAYRLCSVFIAVTFTVSTILPPQVYAQGGAGLKPAPTFLGLPAAGTMLTLTPGFTPPMITGMSLYPDNPLMFDFIVDSGHSKLSGEDLDA